MSNTSTHKKMDFWSVLALVIGSQVGSGVFLLPASLAPYNAYALFGWMISGIGAIILAQVFAELVERFPKTGGAHVFVEKAFGRTASFFVGWTYWIISSISTASVIATAISYLSPLIHVPSVYIAIVYQILLCIIMALINLQGVYTSGKVESVLAGIKVCTLVLLPLCALYYFNSNYIVWETPKDLGVIDTIGSSCALTFWAFIGLEAATTPAESVDNPRRTIPLAIMLGTLMVLGLYMLNSTALIGLIPTNELAQSQAPYVLASQYVFGGNWFQVFAIFAVLVCLSNMNAWVLASGQIAYGIAKDNLLPSLFAKVNQHGAPSWGIIISSALNIPIIIASANENIAKQVEAIIQLSVTAYLFIYAMCAISLMYIAYKETNSLINKPCLLASLACVFCGVLLYSTPGYNIIVCLGIILSGLPIYLSLK